MACRSSGGIDARRGGSEIVTQSTGASSQLIAVELVVRWVVVALLVLSTTAYLGRLHKYFELTSHFRVQYVIASTVCLLICLALANWWWAGGALLSGAINLPAIIPWHRAKEPAADLGIGRQRLRLALVNVYRRNRAHQAFLRCIERHQPDVVVIQEVTDSWAMHSKRSVKSIPSSRCCRERMARGYRSTAVFPLSDCLSFCRKVTLDRAFLRECIPRA